MRANAKVEPGTRMLLWGVHQSDRVPCADASCGEDPHWERPAGDGTGYEANYTAADGSAVFRYHRTNERTAVEATFIEAIPPPKYAHTQRVEIGKLDYPLQDGEAALPGGDIEVARANAIATAENVPVARRAADGVWEKIVTVGTYDIPGAQARVRLVLAGGTEVTADLSDVEVAK